MPSIIEVDTIKNKTGTQNTVLSTDGSGNNTLNANTIKDGSATKTLATLSSSAVTLHNDVTFPVGHVIQTKSVTFYGQQTINNNVFTTIGTGISGEEFTISIAVSSGNKLLISGSVNGASNQRYGGIILCLDNSGTYTWVQDSTSTATGQIFLHTGSGSNTKQAEVLAQFDNNSGLANNSVRLSNVSFQGLYTPSDTNSHTYSVKVGNTYYPSSCATYINRTEVDGDESYIQRAISTFTIQEIQQ
jgi:hypothetical protein